MEDTKGSSGTPEISVSDQNQETSVIGEVNSSAKNHVAYDTYKKVLGEKKRTDVRIAELQSQLDMTENQKMQAEGEQKQLIVKLQKQLNEERGARKADNEANGLAVVTSQVKLEAEKAGCVHLEDLVTLCDLSEIEIDGSYKVSPDSLKRVIDNAKETRPHLFSKAGPEFRDATPIVGASNKQTKSFDEMTAKELDALVAQNKF